MYTPEEMGAEVTIDDTAPFIPYLLGRFTKHSLNLGWTIVSLDRNEDLFSQISDLLRTVSNIGIHHSQQLGVLLHQSYIKTIFLEEPHKGESSL
jgi:hypothetical protein